MEYYSQFTKEEKLLLISRNLLTTRIKLYIYDFK